MPSTAGKKRIWCHHHNSHTIMGLRVDCKPFQPPILPHSALSAASLQGPPTDDDPT